MQEPKKKTRRRFILGGLGVSGALIVGWGLLPPRQRLQGALPLLTEAGEVALNGWIKIAADGTVFVVMHKSEMGQGIHTALQMLVAEELDVALSQIKTVVAPIDKIYGNIAAIADGLPFHPDNQGSLKKTAQWMTAKLARELGIQMTGGSSSVKDSWMPMRQAGATARAMLVQAAAKEWGVDAAQCSVSKGVVSHASGKSAHYGELAPKAMGTAPNNVRLKDPKDFSLIGKAQARTDIAGKVNGTALFGIDTRPPSLVFAAIKMAPVLGGTVRQVHAEKIKQKPGVMHVIDFSADVGAGHAGVAVVAKDFWRAKQACEELVVEWDANTHAQLDSAAVFKELAQQLDTESGFTYYSQGDVKQGLADPTATLIKAEYRAPFLAHATMEPINCTAQVKDGRVDVWVSTQVPSIAVGAAAKTAKISAENVHIHMFYLGGGFGRRLEVDMVVQAVAIARQTQGAPVQVIWSREQDTRYDMYRPAALARFSAAVSKQGQVLAYENKSASGSVTQQVMKRSFGLPAAGPDKTTAEGEFDMPYEFAHQKIAHVIVPTPVPIGYWRSVGHSHNAFFKESFIDELAHAVGKTPIDFRRELLKNHPRHRTVLELAVKAAAEPTPAGRARGIALHQSFGSIVCEIAEVSVEDTAIKVHKVWCAVDCGIAVNPDTIAQQMESAIIFGLSAALYGEITFKNGAVEQSNFHDYQVVRMHETPEIFVEIVKSTEPPEGIGEPGTPPIAPAVANALFALKGQRLRSLPLRLA